MTVCTALDNGVRILSRPLPGRHSAALGFWLRNGSRHDGAAQTGWAHLLEHLLFHGGGRYARHFEALGGQINARTMRELTAFHGLVSADHAYLLARLFTSLLLEPRLGSADIAAELPAVRHEQRLAAEADWEATVLAQVWGVHPMARSIPGETLALPAATALQGYCAERLNGAALCVVAAGTVDHDALVEACRGLERLPAGTRAPQTAPAFTPCARRAPLAGTGATAELLWVMPAPTLADPAHWAFTLAEQIAAGAPLSARLQHELRGRRGLVYAVESRVELYTDCGLWWLRLQCEPGQAQACRDAVEAVMADLIEHGPGHEETIRVMALLQARWTLEEDDPECVMERIAHEIAYLDRVTALNERLARLAAVGRDDMRAVLARAWRQRATFEWGTGTEDGGASLAEHVRETVAPATARRAG